MKEKLYRVIFESDTPAGKLFDVCLLWVILFSLLIIMLESVRSLRGEYGDLMRSLEWVVTAIFTVEYALRIYCAPNRPRYIFSFYGLVDLFSIIPTYLSIFLPNTQFFLVVRSLRLLRVFRVLKLTRYLREANVLSAALRASRAKITVFVGTVLTISLIVGTVLHLVEGPENGFTSIPKSMYWAIVTLTTVGYGDIAPQTTLGQTLAALVMIMGYGIIAVPTGILSVELAKAEVLDEKKHAPVCEHCRASLLIQNARFCPNCGVATDLK